MEVKVSVDGIPRVVCGVTRETTCQEVVLALAQALGQPGRYNLREKFKEFERCMTPDERLLETLERYGEQAKEVQLILFHNGPSTWDDMSRAKVGRYQACPPLRRKDAGGRMRRGSSSLSLHRQSLPPLSCTGEVEKKQEDVKRPKRKSLTLMEEAWEWLESLGKGRVYSTACDKDSGKKTDKKNRISLDVHLAVDKDKSGRSSRGKARGQKSVKSDLDHQTSCCMGNQTRSKEGKHSKKAQEGESELHGLSSDGTEAEKNQLRETIICQLVCLQNLQSQIAQVDREISELEGKQRARRGEQEARERAAEEETEQIQFWENELKAEEGYEKDLQGQFLEMRAKAVECKMKLEEYKHKMQGFDFLGGLNVSRDDCEMDSGDGAEPPTETSAISPQDINLQQSDPEGSVNVNRAFLPREDFSPPHALVAPSQIKERRPTGPTELREWWTRWSEAHSSQSQAEKVIHRSELTIYLGSTKV
ncbi:ras association domain-containing protein 8 [Salarias fasciatus]|uniref:ras association domain-containing protein 8 n=1 Tax=Salarias fasciatus TaxID=181472 RepID=UPI0011766DCE|nr:ras association domain-containing protein 8-like [Salarias fasciatus]XP_029974030.1 ras association domain-containing protein 8-like [Salarias fasciatus]XP_029974031.1 ras association domain-containing protein 8-like [Salarias fasciatus]XP_029974032.1 ras association domain-containing protein 8-like [Salarias fasciatus]